jgi:hypothetical protein
MDWQFDYETFLRNFLTEDYFHAFVMIQDEMVIGTGNVFHSHNIGWLANIIIAEKFRGQGLGCKMTQFLVDFLFEKGCETQLLIATSLGEPIYRKIGFKKITAYQSFDGQGDYDFISPHHIRALKNSDLKAVYQLDRIANGENRTHLIDKFYIKGRGYFNSENELLGFFLPDFGHGLVISKDKQAGIDLLRLKHANKGKRTLLPMENQEGIDYLINQGFKKGDPCVRMILGKENKWHPKYIYSYGSGYCG